MALNSYARLKLQGTSLAGDTTQVTMGGVDVSSDYIELHEVRWGLGVSSSTTTVRPGRPVLQPIALTKGIDQSTPQLYRALAVNAVLDGDILLFDTHPEDGSTRHRFTLTLANARVQSIASCSPDTLDPTVSGRPAREVVTIAAPSLRLRDEVRSVEYQYDAVVQR